jgi:hypothetical protein
LVIAGSGIRAIGQFTLEAQAHIREGDAVFFVVSDPATEQWIREQNPTAVDLYSLYDNDKPRHDTYIQMSEVMLREVRKGLNVVGVFYGHPGVFVNPSHRAIAIARAEGFQALMLPGVSAQDCLFADLGVDPSTPGCQVLEATDLLLRRRTLQTDAHVIIFQAGSVGDMGFRFRGFPNTRFPVLVNYLDDWYGPDHPVIHYIASQFSLSQALTERLTVGRLSDPDIAASITGISTLYLPPKEARQNDPEMASRLGLRVQTTTPQGSRPFLSGQPYGERERRAIAALDEHTPSPEYRPSRPSPALYEVLKELALSPNALSRYLQSPKQVLSGDRGLSDEERRALMSGHQGRLRLTMQRDALEVATSFLHVLIRNADLAHRYRQAVLEARDVVAADSMIVQSLRSFGYDVTPAALIAAEARSSSSDLDYWASRYMVIADGRHRVLTIGRGRVLLDGAPINNASFGQGRLRWSEVDANDSSGSLDFRLVFGSQENVSDYVGPQCSGEIWQPGSQQPSRPNTFGKVYIFTQQALADPLATDPFATWEGNYTTYIRERAGWVQGPSLVIGHEGESPTVTYGDRRIESWTFSSNALRWEGGRGEQTSGAITFLHLGSANGPVGSSRFAGKVWTRIADIPREMNIYGQVGKPRDARRAAENAQAALMWTTAGTSLAFGVACVRLTEVVRNAAGALRAYIEQTRRGDAPEEAAATAWRTIDARVEEAVSDAARAAERAVALSPGVEPTGPPLRGARVSTTADPAGRPDGR